MNTGNSHYGATPNPVNAIATLTNANGDVVTSGKTVLTGNSIVPTFGRQFSISLRAGNGLSDGKYRLAAEAALQDGTVLDQKSLDFTISGGEVVLGATAATSGNGPAGNGNSDSGGMLVLILGAFTAALLVLVVINVLIYRRRQNRPAAE